MKKTIKAHVDADCFYVSCERIRDSRLCGKPVAVLGNQGACVIARSYEMRESGVKVGMPIWKAKKICPEGIYIKRDFRWYGEISYKMQNIFKRFTDVVEHYSVDESFLDLGDWEGDLQALALNLRHVVKEELDIPVSVGLADTRILSKVAAKIGKPFGAVVINDSERRDLLKTVPVEDVPGIGRKISRRLLRMGVETAYDYTVLPREFVKKTFYKPGEEIWYELRGHSILPINSFLPERKMLSRGGSIWGHHADPKYVWGFLVRNLERLIDVLWKEDLEASCLVLKLRTSCGRYFQTVESFDVHTQLYSDFLKILKKAFLKIFNGNFTYCYVHIVVTDLRNVKGKQMILFNRSSEKEKNMQTLKKKLNQKFGLFKVRSAATAYIPAVFKDKTSDYEICDIEGKVCF